ncbi:MAG: hypothetical protein ABW133_23490 [Polyangiaceae bacterium]
MKRVSVLRREFFRLATAGCATASLIACSADSGSGGTGGSRASGGVGGASTGGASSGGSAGSGAVGGSGGAGGSGTGGAGAGGSATGGTGGSGGSGTGGSAGKGTDAGSSGGAGGAAGSGGSAGKAGGGASGSGGNTNDGGTKADAAGGAGGGSTTDGGCMPGDGGTSNFSFFLTSLVAIRRESGSQNGFGGDLSLGKTDSMGAKDGLAGADEICRRIADNAYPGAGCKTWRAFLSVTKGPNNGPAINAIDRVGNGPWYDRVGRVVAMNKAALLGDRPTGMDPAIINDFPNEFGTPNQNPDGTGAVDNHDVLTGSDAMGKVYSTGTSATCKDWTSKVGADGKPRVGHSWPRAISGTNWMSCLNEAGCAPGVFIVEMGPPIGDTVGGGGGYGGFYCFEYKP